MLDKFMLRTYDIDSRGYPNRRGKHSLKLTFYPKCKKPIEIKAENIPFGTVTIGSCIAKMQPKSFDYFRIGIGFRPRQQILDDKISTEAFEEEITFACSVAVHMTKLYINVKDFTK